MKLITEEIDQVEVIVEERNGKKNLFIEGIFLQGEIKNRNGRMYPMNTLSREVGRYNENFVCKGRALGELGHPDGPTVNLDRVSHKITSLRQEGNNFIGKAQILSTPMGNIAKSLLKPTKDTVELVRILPLLLLLISFQIHPLQMLSSMALWKVKIGFGMVTFSVNVMLRRPTRELIL